MSNSDIYNLEQDIGKFNMFRSNDTISSLSICKNVENYFNNMIDTKQQTGGVIFNTNNTFKNFYDKYIIPNALLIVLIIAVIILVIIRYLCDKSSKKLNKNIDNINENDIIQDEITEHVVKQVILPESSHKFDDRNKYKKYKNKLRKEREEIKKEKLKILEIIDELSSMNTAKINDNKQNNYVKNFNEYDGYGNYVGNLDDYTNYNPNYNPNTLNDFQEFNNNDTDGYYDMTKQNNDSNNYINDMYIEPPYS